MDRRRSVLWRRTLIAVAITATLISVMTPFKDGAPGASSSAIEAQWRGVLLKKFKPVENSIELGRYGHISVQEAWGERPWNHGNFVWSTNRDRAPTLYDLCIVLKGSKEDLLHFTESDDSLQVGIHPKKMYKMKVMYLQRPQPLPLPDTIDIPFVLVDNSKHVIGTALDTLAVLRLVAVE